MSRSFFKKTFGPGLIFAGTAIGVSHLVQSTRAGADYGYALIWAVVLANFFKYPFFEFGTRYAQATGTTLLKGYRQLGKWTLWLYFIITLVSMFTVTGAVSFVTTALLSELLCLSDQTAFYAIAAALFVATVAILLIGKFKILDTLMKVVATVLTVSTLAAFFLLVFKGSDHLVEPQTMFAWDGKEHLIFAIALMGWMPTAVDLSAWNSIWTVEKMKTSNHTSTLKQALLDFKIGYLLSAGLALIFIYLGAELMYFSGQSFPDSSTGFVSRLIALFTGTLGQWSYVVIALSAFSVMLSTTVSVFDGYSRAMGETSSLLQFPKWMNGNFWLIVTAIGGFLVISIFKNQLKPLVDLATIVSFLIAPVVALLNYKLIISNHTPRVAQPGKWIKLWAISGIAFLSIFTGIYIWISIS